MLLADLDNRRGILGKSQRVAAFGNQCFSSFSGLVRPHPGIDPFHVDLGLGIGRLDTERERIDVTDHL